MPLLLNQPTKPIDLNNSITLLSSKHLIGWFYCYQLIFHILCFFLLEHKQSSDILWYIFSKLVHDKNTCWHQLELCYILHHSKLALGLYPIVKKVEVRNKQGRHTWHRIKKNVLLKSSSSVTCLSSLIVLLLIIIRIKHMSDLFFKCLHYKGDTYDGFACTWI